MPVIACDNDCLARNLADTWQKTMGSIFGIPSHERTRMAIVSVDDSITQLQTVQDKIKSELFEMAIQVRQQQSTKLKMHSQTIDSLLRRSRAKRLQLTSLNKKLTLLETQKDTLHASEVNQQVFSSMQTTSAALKSIGLDKTLTSVDEVMSDISDSNADVRAIQEGLGAELSMNSEISDSDLQEELRFLLEDDLDTTSLLRSPPMANKMPTQEEYETLPRVERVETHSETQKELLLEA